MAERRRHGDRSAAADRREPVASGLSPIQWRGTSAALQEADDQFRAGLVRLPKGPPLDGPLYGPLLVVVARVLALLRVGLECLGRIGGFLVFLGLRGDIVEIDRLAIVQVVNRVDATVGPLFDRTFGLVFLLRGFLAAAESLWRRGRTEVGRAISAAARTAGTRTTEAAATAKTTAARPWSAEATSAWTRTAEAAPRPGTAETTTGGTRTGWTIFPRARFADRQVAAHERLRVEFVDDLLGNGALGELDERESARASRFAVHGHDDMGGLGDGREVGSEIRFRRAVREVPYEQTDSQLCLGETGRILSQGCGKHRIWGEHPPLEGFLERHAARDVLQNRDEAGAADLVEQPARRIRAFRIRDPGLIARQIIKAGGQPVE